MKQVACAMTIAGSDSSGGAGIEADLKTFAALSVYGTCAITAITAQNTMGVYEIFPIPAKTVKKQIETVLADIHVRHVKTGMLYSKEIVETVAEAIVKFKLMAVVDPVFRAGTGAMLVQERDKKALKQFLIPKAYIVTPNRYEAEDLAGIRIKTVDDMKRAAEEIAQLGAKAVIVKGGHVESGEYVTDVFYYKDEFQVFTKPRIKVPAHGSGCTFSAAITAYLSLGYNLFDSVANAEKFVQEAITFSQKVGKGRIPVNPSAFSLNRAEKFSVLENVSSAVKTIENQPVLSRFIAEVGMQIGMALPYASDKKDVASVKGRIVRYGNNPKAVGCVEYGASDHIARIILTAMKHDSTKRAAMNLRYDPRLVDAFRKMGLVVSTFDRKIEPKEIKKVEGGTLIWGVEAAIRNAGKVPDVIYDLGDVGKEAMIRVLGSTATEVVEKALKAIRKTRTKF